MEEIFVSGQNMRVIRCTEQHYLGPLARGTLRDLGNRMAPAALLKTGQHRNSATWKLRCPHPFRHSRQLVLPQGTSLCGWQQNNVALDHNPVQLW